MAIRDSRAAQRAAWRKDTVRWAWFRLPDISSWAGFIAGAAADLPQEARPVVSHFLPHFGQTAVVRMQGGRKFYTSGAQTFLDAIGSGKK